MSRLEGKVILTTGGTQGIGEAVALHAAREGAAGIAISGRQQDRGQPASRLQELGIAQSMFMRTYQTYRPAKSLKVVASSVLAV